MTGMTRKQLAFTRATAIDAAVGFLIGVLAEDNPCLVQGRSFSYAT
jgi:hypothetical protein